MDKIGADELLPVVAEDADLVKTAAAEADFFRGLNNRQIFGVKLYKPTAQAFTGDGVLRGDKSADMS